MITKQIALKSILWYYYNECKTLFKNRLEKYINNCNDGIIVQFFAGLHKQDIQIDKEEVSSNKLVDLLNENNFDTDKIRYALEYACEQEKKLMAEFIVNLKNSELKAECYYWFVHFPVISIPVEILLNDTISKNEKLAHAAFDCLENIKDNKVRELALKNIRNGYYVSDSFTLLKQNYKKHIRKNGFVINVKRLPQKN